MTDSPVAGDDLTPAAAEPVPPTQVRHSWRATLRTVLQYVLAVVTALPVIIPGILDATDGTPVKKYVVIAAGQVLIVIGVITKIMAIPTVDRWLTAIGIGAGPAAGKHEANDVDSPASTVVHVTVDPAVIQAQIDKALSEVGQSLAKVRGRHEA